MQATFKTFLVILLLSAPWTSHAMLVNDAHTSPAGAASVIAQVEFFTAQGGGMSLSDAINSVKRDGNVERIISAKTETSGGRETHVIKALYKNGQVKTHRIPGKKR